MRFVELEAIRAALSGARDPGLEVERRPLRGGLTAGAVAAVRVRRGGADDGPTFVLKTLPAGAAREARVYEALLRRRRVAPRLLHVERGAGAVTLVLEHVPSADDWPWRDAARSAAVLSAIAALHAAPPAGAARILPPSGSEAELAASAAETLATVEAIPPPWPGRRWPVRAARRVVAALPALRDELLASPRLPPTLLHGDLHSGNVVVRPGGEIVLLDWDRARIGSPLEDVASWLVSLAHHEPEARRRHDTLLGHYLAARGLPPRLDAGLRRAYWIASACNALAGALRYHLLRSSDAALPPGPREDAARSARDWLRVLRRADAWTAGPRC